MHEAPHAVVCGESALSLHELIDDIPHEVHIAVPRGGDVMPPVDDLRDRGERYVRLQSDDGQETILRVTKRLTVRCHCGS